MPPEKRKKKPKKERPKKERPEREKISPEPRVLSNAALVVVIAFCLTVLFAVIFLSTVLSEHSDMVNARNAFSSGDYQRVYEELNNKKLEGSDEVMFQRAKTVLSLRRKLDSYQRRMNLGEDLEALDALFQGVYLYQELLSSDQNGALEELTEIYQQICTILENDYGVSAEEAIEINSYDDESYTRRLDALLHGTEEDFFEEESVEETPDSLEDILPDEEAFADMETM